MQCKWNIAPLNKFLDCGDIHKSNFSHIWLFSSDYSIELEVVVNPIDRVVVNRWVYYERVDIQLSYQTVLIEYPNKTLLFAVKSPEGDTTVNLITDTFTYHNFCLSATSS